MRKGGGWRALAAVAWIVLAAGRAQATEPTVVRVVIEGNVRVEDDAIRVNLESRPGTPVDPARVDRDVRAIYGMGFFDQVDVEVREEPDGTALVFRVRERSLVRKVTIDGTDKLKREDVEGALRVRPHTIFDPTKARRASWPPESCTPRRATSTPRSISPPRRPARTRWTSPTR